MPWWFRWDWAAAKNITRAGLPMKHLVLLSGGIDSAVALRWSLRQTKDVVALTFDYHDRAAQEKQATVALAEAAGVPLRVVTLPFLREASDLSAEDRQNPHLADAPEGYVPARNLVFYAIAANVAETLGASTIVGGHHGEDAELFPDASRPFFDRFEDLARLGVWSYRKRPFDVALPLGHRTKEEVVRLAFEWNVPLELTWSCYGDGARACGRCRSCAERSAAFEAVGAADPALVA
ncbi:MAG TPA: 7-cyano-7-deazaguanine synthase [Candidatus Thermoplasmatota archaeon]|nr:7-cyano-7-deazaguanine synthase [Candidatus Thermoplasmatota archaeon]